MHVSIVGAEHADSDEVAAALSAIVALLEAEAAGTSQITSRLSGWQQTIRLSGQNLPIEKPATTPAWNTAERIRRAGRAGTGIVGL
jgi:hypothetical protein